MKKNILITGGLGFIGSRLVQKLKSHKNNIIILDNFYSNVTKKSNCKIINADITNYKALEKINLKKKIDVIYHLAGQSSGPKSSIDPQLDARLNIIGTLNLLRFASKNKIKKFIFSSTFTVYGDPLKNFTKLNENDDCKPKSMYGISKKACEDYIKVICNKEKIDWTILRLFNVYGPGQNIKRLDQGIVGIFINLITSRDKILVTGSLDRFKDLIFIDDVVEAFFLCLKKKSKNQTFNLGTGRKTLISDLINKIIDIFENGKKKKIIVKEAPHGEIKGAFADIKKIKKFLNFEPKFDLESGLHKFKKYLKF